MADLHGIYHPPAVENLSLTGDLVGRWLLRWSDSAAFPAEYNTVWTAVLGRSTFQRNLATGALTAPPGPWTYVGHLTPNTRRYFFAPAEDVAGFEYTVAGMTRGDHLRLRGSAGVGIGVEHGSLTLADDDRPWGLGSETVTVVPPGPVGRYTLGFDGFRQVSFGGAGSAQWRFSVFGDATTRHGVALGAGDMLISRIPAAGEANPFEPASLVPFSVTYGATTVAVVGCGSRTSGDGRYLCHVPADLPLVPEEVPLRLVVATAVGVSGTSPLAGSHPVDRNPVGFVNYGGTTAGDWRFAFWGRTVSGLRVTHGGPVTLRPGDVVISHARPYGPNGFADSPFAAGAFKPLRINYGDLAVEAPGCTTHFYNVDRYECHVAGAFTFDADNIPDHVAVNRIYAPGPTTPRPGSTPAVADAGPTTCTTTPTDTCPPTGH